MAIACAATHVRSEPPGYRRRRPETTVLYQVVARELRTFLAQVEQRGGAGLPGFVRRELAALLSCGITARGFARRTGATVWEFRVVVGGGGQRAASEGFSPVGGWCVTPVAGQIGS